MTMTFTPASDVVVVYNGPLCQACGGPCRDWKGSVWGWTCAACINQEMAIRAARADAKDRKARERLARKTFHNDEPTLRASGQRRDGGAPRYVPTTVSALTPKS